MAESMSDVFREIDERFMKTIGSKAVDQIMIDIQNPKLSLKQIADKNRVNLSTVTQVCRFHRIDANANPIK